MKRVRGALCGMLIVFTQMYAMGDFLDDRSCSDNTSSFDGPKQPKWMTTVDKLAKELKPYVCSEPIEPIQAEEADHSSDSDDDFDGFKTALKNALEVYIKINPCGKEKAFNGPCLTAISNRLNWETLTSHKIMAVSWLNLVDHEYRDFFKKSMLEWAICNKHTPVIKYLVKQEGADLTVPNLVGSVPLVLACEVGDPKIVNFLLKKGGLTQEKKKETYRSALETAQRYHRKDVEEILLQYEPEKNGLSAFFNACKQVLGLS